MANPNPNDPTSPGPWIRANANTAPFVAPPQGCDGVTPSTITSGTRCLTNTRDFLNILPPQTKENFVALGSFKINQDHKAFGEFSHFKTDTVSKITPTPVNEAFGGPGGTLGPAFYIPAGSKYNTTGQDIAIRSRLVEYGSRTSQNIASGDRVVAGVKGTIKDWEYEVNAGRSTYNVGVSYLAGYANRELLYQAYSNGLINPFGNTDAADFQAFRNLAGIEGKLRDSTFTTSWVGAKANGEPFHVAAGPVGVAMGVERRKETMNDDPGEILRQGLDMAGSGETLPVSGSRTVNAIFGEMAIPLVKGLEAQVAARVDDYSDFGRTTNPKVGLRWQPDKSFMVRASYGEGFRAPTLDELYSQQQTGNASSSFNDPSRCGKAGGDASYDCGADSKLQYNIKSGGNTQLKPETSDQYSIGFVWQPTNWFSADIGIWDVKITNQIQAGIDEALLINDLVNNNGALYGNYVVRYAPSASDIANGLPGKIQYLDERNINYAATKAGGIDYDLLVKLPEFGGAKWALQLVGSHMLKYKTGPQATGPMDVLNKFRINGNTIVKDRFQLSLRAQAGTWGATLSGNYVGSFEDENPNGEGAKVASYLTWDGQVRYSGFKDLTILGGVKNIFNKRPPYTNQESEIWYPGFNPYLHDVRNRMVYVGLTYKFK